MFTSAQPPCSKCHQEPRYPGQRWGKRCFARYHAERRARLRRAREEEAARDEATTVINHRAENTAPPLFEQLKRVITEIPKYPNRPETIRVSLLPWHEHTYVEVRVYLAGKPTRKGIAIHSDLLPQVVAACQQALRTSWDQVPRPMEREPVPARGQSAVYWPEEVWPG